MINPSTLTDAVVATLQSIPDLVTALGNDPTRIYAFHYLYGQDEKLTKALYKMVPPSILCVWEGTMGGNFDAATLWKHKIGLYTRIDNTANLASPLSYETLFWLIVNSPVFPGTVNIRYTNVLNSVDIMDVPQAIHLEDPDGMDYFKIEFVFPELGDN
jgi:hypothetical protein